MSKPSVDFNTYPAKDINVGIRYCRKHSTVCSNDISLLIHKLCFCCFYWNSDLLWSPSVYVPVFLVLLPSFVQGNQIWNWCSRRCKLVLAFPPERCVIGLGFFLVFPKWIVHGGPLAVIGLGKKKMFDILRLFRQWCGQQLEALHAVSDTEVDGTCSSRLLSAICSM